MQYNYVYMLKYHYRVARVQAFVNSIISSGDILLHSNILLYTSGMLSYLQRGRIERRQGRSQKCEGMGGAKLCLPPRFGQY